MSPPTPAIARYCLFIHAPARIGRLRKSRPAALLLGKVAQHPAQDGRVGHCDATLSHHGGQITVAELVREVPTDAQFNDLRGVATTAVDRVARHGSGMSDL
jgi:hypothetical protein